MSKRLRPHVYVHTCAEPGCGTFESEAFNAKRCPKHRAAHNKAQALVNFHKRKQSGKSHHKHDTTYGGTSYGAPPSVYSHGAAIPLIHEVGRCQCCQQVKNLINNYCAMCRGNGANEAQIKNPRALIERAKQMRNKK